MAILNSTIELLKLEDAPFLKAHFDRHVAESGRNGSYHFMPYDPDDLTDGPKGIDANKLRRQLTITGWQRCFVMFNNARTKIIAHVDLKSDPLKAGLHRCVLGIGIEAPYRGQGLGKRLMHTAIEFAKNEASLDWIDLQVFTHNLNAHSLYKQMGFIEIGRLRDKIRIGDKSIDDIWMVLDVATE